MHPALGLEPAVGALARDLEDGRLDPGFLAGTFLDPLDLVAALLRPADVHAEQHLGPVLRFSAAGTGMDLEEAVVAVRLAGEQALQLATLRLVAGRGKRGFRLAVGVFVGLFLGKLSEREAVVQLLLQPLVGGDRRIEASALLHHRAGALGIGPEVGVLGLAVQRLQAVSGAVEVKGASSAASATA